MKNYYQKRSSGYTLHPQIYAKTIKFIKCYSFFTEYIQKIESMQKIKLTENHIVNKNVAEENLNIIRRALEIWVASEYQEAVLMHTAYGYEYSILETKYNISCGCMKKWCQRFIYGVAVELGEDFQN